MRISDGSSDGCSSDLLLTEIPQPQHAGAVALYRLWQDLTPAGGLPARDGFTFERLGAPGILGNFFVVEPLDGGRDWRYRLLGTPLTRPDERRVGYEGVSPCRTPWSPDQ